MTIALLLLVAFLGITLGQPQKPRRPKQVTAPSVEVEIPPVLHDGEK